MQGFPFKSQRIYKIEALKLQFFDETDALKKRDLKKAIDSEIEAAFAAAKRSFGYDVTSTLNSSSRKCFTRTRDSMSS